MTGPWYVGETKYAYVQVSSAAGAVTISSANYTIYDTSDESIVASGVASIDGQTVYALWIPTAGGIFVVDFDYIIGSETHTSKQVIEVKETM